MVHQAADSTLFIHSTVDQHTVFHHQKIRDPVLRIDDSRDKQRLGTVRQAAHTYALQHRRRHGQRCRRYLLQRPQSPTICTGSTVSGSSAGNDNHFRRPVAVQIGDKTPVIIYFQYFLRIVTFQIVNRNHTDQSAFIQNFLCLAYAAVSSHNAAPHDQFQDTIAIHILIINTLDRCAAFLQYSCRLIPFAALLEDINFQRLAFSAFTKEQKRFVFSVAVDVHHLHGLHVLAPRGCSIFITAVHQRSNLLLQIHIFFR